MPPVLQLQVQLLLFSKVGVVMFAMRHPAGFGSTFTDSATFVHTLRGHRQQPQTQHDSRVNPSAVQHVIDQLEGPAPPEPVSSRKVTEKSAVLSSSSLHSIAFSGYREAIQRHLIRKCKTRSEDDEITSISSRMEAPTCTSRATENCTSDPSSTSTTVTAASAPYKPLLTLLFLTLGGASVGFTSLLSRMRPNGLPITSSVDKLLCEACRAEMNVFLTNISRDNKYLLMFVKRAFPNWKGALERFPSREASNLLCVALNATAAVKGSENVASACEKEKEGKLKTQE